MSDCTVLVEQGTPNHECDPPSFTRSDFNVNDVVQCNECGRKWVVRMDVFDHEVWTRLRWYHRSAQRLLRETITGRDS